MNCQLHGGQGVRLLLTFFPSARWVRLSNLPTFPPRPCCGLVFPGLDPGLGPCAACIDSPGVLLKIHIPGPSPDEQNQSLLWSSLMHTVGCICATISDNFICLLNAKEEGAFYLFRKIKAFPCHHQGVLVLYSEKGKKLLIFKKL